MFIDLKQVERDSQETTAPHNLRLISEHFGIFRDLFKDAYFVPRVSLDIKVEYLLQINYKYSSITLQF